MLLIILLIVDTRRCHCQWLDVAYRLRDRMLIDAWVVGDRWLWQLMRLLQWCWRVGLGHEVLLVWHIRWIILILAAAATLYDRCHCLSARGQVLLATARRHAIQTILVGCIRGCSISIVIAAISSTCSCSGFRNCHSWLFLDHLSICVHLEGISLYFLPLRLWLSLRASPLDYCIILLLTISKLILVTMTTVLLSVTIDSNFWLHIARALNHFSIEKFEFRQRTLLLVLLAGRLLFRDRHHLLTRGLGEQNKLSDFWNLVAGFLNNCALRLHQV